MEGMARTAEQVKPQSKPTYEQKSMLTEKDVVKNIPMEVFRFFSLNPATDSGNDHLRTVSEWALDDTKSLGGALRKIRSLEMKLGSPRLDETRVGKLYNWIRMSNSIKETSKTMRGEINTIRSKYQRELSAIKNNNKDRLVRLENELLRIKREQSDTAKRLKNRNMGEIGKIEREYEKQLKELRSIRSAYKGGK